MSEFLRDPRPNVEFIKHEYASKMLHEEIIAFEKAVNTFNTEKKTTFDSLLESLKSAVIEAVPGADVRLFFLIRLENCIVGYLWVFFNRFMSSLVRYRYSNSNSPGYIWNFSTRCNRIHFKSNISELNKQYDFLEK